MLNSTLYDIDISILRLIHHHRIEALDGALYIISFATSFISIGIILGILFTSIKLKSRPLRIIFFKMLAVLIIAATVSFSIKTLFTRERPFITYPDIEKLSEAGSSSFPSGHTIEAFAIAVALSILIPKRKFIIPALSWAFLVAYTRLALGVHYPGDVLGGMIIGTMIGWLVPVLFDKLYPVK